MNTQLELQNLNRLIGLQNLTNKEKVGMYFQEIKSCYCYTAVTNVWGGSVLDNHIN